MKNPDCIFCKIVAGEIPSFKIYEDNDFIGILDVFPNTKGMSLLLTKDHYDSYLFDMPDAVYNKYLLAAKNLGKLIDKKLNVKRTAMVMEGMGVNHAHIKFYPLHGLGDEWKSMDSPETKFFDNYPGYLSTHLGNKATDDELKKIQKLFKD
ncbi:MAG TPA: diadenosine tetraphosphate hydrolase [Bacteroidetes bacterium]|nr:diadenosine tetraphosphate hydrolase [Bacteroidota bacterium]HCN36648.1 diadenosine tetraphosphate hydrolase [Bacteroidota bacterium]